MIVKEFEDLLDNPCTLEELLVYKEKLLKADITDDEVIDGLFDIIQAENKLVIDRQVATRAIITYICTTGDFCYFIKTLLKDFLEKDGCSKEAIAQVLKQASEQSKQVRIKNREKHLQEKRKLEEEKRRKEERLRKLEESIDMSKTEVSYDTARFLIRNGVTYEALKNSPYIYLVSQKDIDPLLDKYRIESDGKEEIVSIADIVGYSYNGENDLLRSFPKFFNSNSSEGYYTRALSMLDFTTEDALEKLSQSFHSEPMKLKDAPGGIFTISTNGMHRYSVLRGLYCIEMAKANGNKEIEKMIYDKYKVPAIVSRIDYVKTYANYILTTLKVATFVSNERDSDFHSTGRIQIKLVSGETLFLTNEEVLQYVGDIIRINKDNLAIDIFKRDISESFKVFLSLAVPELFGANVSSTENENEKII